MSEDQVKEKLSQGLLKKIKEAYHLKKDYQEALSYINYYISNIGSNNEILLYKNKIEKKLSVEPDSMNGEEKHEEPIFPEETGVPDQDVKTRIETDHEPADHKQADEILDTEYLVNGQDEGDPDAKKSDEDKAVKDLFLLDSEQLVPETDNTKLKEDLPAFDTFDDMFELDKKEPTKDPLTSEQEDIPEAKKADDDEHVFNIEDNQLPEAEKQQDFELDFDSKEEPKILDLDQEIVIQPESKADEEEVIPEEITPAEETPQQEQQEEDSEPLTITEAEETFTLETPQISSMDEEIVEIQTDSDDQPEPEEELSFKDEEPQMVPQEKKLLDFGSTSSEKPIIKQAEPSSGIDQFLQKFSKKQLYIGAGILIVLIAIILYFLFKSNNDLLETPQPPVETVKKEQPRTRKLTASPARKSPSQKIDSSDEDFKKYLSAAEMNYKKGDYEQSQKYIQQAKKIKTNARLIQLENQVQKKISEKRIEELTEISQQKKEEETESEREEKSFQKIASSTDISVLENFLTKYPFGKHTIEVKKRIQELKKKEREMIENQIRSDVRLYKKTQLRIEFQYLSQQDITAILNKARTIRHKFESKVINGEQVIIDYTTGLMWHFWEEPMEFSKAKWWSARRYADYHNWRLPTAEEVSSLLNISSQYLSPRIKSSQFEVWSGDFNNTDSSSLWVFFYSEGNFKPVDSYQYKYLCSVRSISN